MKKLKKTLALVLAAVMLLGVAPAALADGAKPLADGVKYIRNLLVRRAIEPAMEAPVSNEGADGKPVTVAAPDNAGVPLLTDAIKDNTYIKNNYVFKDHGKLNGGGGFYRTDYNRVNMVEPPYYFSDAYSHYFQRVNNDSTWRARYYWGVGGIFHSLAANGELDFLLTAEVKYDTHLKAFTHAHWTLDDMGLIRLYSTYESFQLRELINDADNDKDQFYIKKGGDWWDVPTNINWGLNLFLWHNQGDKCWDGDSGVHNASIAFADTVYPVVTDLTITGDNDGKYYYGAADKGQKIQFKVTFSEYIRFADARTSAVADTNNRVKLAAYRRSDRASIDAYAKLVQVGYNYLIYEYTIPEDADQDFIITGLSANQDGALFHEEDLKLYTIDGKYEQLQNESGNLKTDATFTDLAGNSIRERWGAVSFPQEIHVDAVSPELNAVNISGSMMMGGKTEGLEDGWNKSDEKDSWPEDIDRSQVFAGVGDTLTFYVDFDEELKKFATDGAMGDEEAKQFVATLNIKDEDGEYVTIKGATAASVDTSVNSNIPVTRITFEPLTITKDMYPADDGKPISIMSISVSGNTIADLCGNALSGSLETELPAPKQQEWLDTVAPTTQTGGIVQETSTYSGGGEATGFRIMLQVTENSDGRIVTAGNQVLYRSGTAGVGDGNQAQESGVLIITDTDTTTLSKGAKYEYAVSLDETAPETGWTTSAVELKAKFTQVDSTMYLHVRPVEGGAVPIMKPSIKITGYDYAGNGNGMAEPALSSISITERVMPTSTAAFSSVLAGSAVTVTGKATASDLGGLETVKYRFVLHAIDTNDEEDPDTSDLDTLLTEAKTGDGWKTVPLERGALTAKLEGTQAATVGKDNFIYLCVYMKDRSGNETVETHLYRVNLRLPNFDLSIPDEAITEANKNEQKIKIGLLDTTDAAGMDPVNVWRDPWIWSYGALFVTLVPKQMTGWTDKERSITMLVDELLDSQKKTSVKPGNTGPVDKLLSHLPPRPNLQKKRRPAASLAPFYHPSQVQCGRREEAVVFRCL